MFPVRGIGALEPQTGVLFERSTFISAYILFAESWVQMGSSVCCVVFFGEERL